MKFTRKASGHFVTLIEVDMHLIECISGHNYSVIRDFARDTLQDVILAIPIRTPQTKEQSIRW